ncbi:MAG: alginate lyase family protein [Prevotella sp.]|nr:alginate lyase family protein [Prevotella sp.]MDY4038343.1 alginate lyase family protein [Prevotella sp.]
MKRFLTAVLVLLPCLMFGGEPLVPANMALLRDLKTAYEKNDPQVARLVGKYETAAEKVIQAKAPSVTMKKKLPPSNDKRDYVSLSRYWWPDSMKQDGLPYVRRDGQVNPEIDDYTDIAYGDKMGHAVELLSTLYYITGNESYAQHCARYLRTWFTDRKTGMNPNMVFAQFIPGRTTLRGTGLLDGRRFARALCFSQLIESSAAWTPSDRQALKAWARAYCYWYENSTQGQLEHRAKNNHGLWYDVTHLMLLSYLDEREAAARVIKGDIMDKLDSQIAADGSLPEELARTLSLHYSTFVMESLTTGNYIARQLGMSIWTMRTKSGKTAAQCLDFLYPYYLNPTSWPHRQIRPFDVKRVAVILYEAGTDLGNTQYVRQAEKVGIDGTSTDTALLPYYKLRKS